MAPHQKRRHSRPPLREGKGRESYTGKKTQTGICPSHLMMTGLTSRFSVSASPSDKWDKRPGLPLPGQQ